MRRRTILAGLFLLLGGCARTLPDQDRRIYGAVPVAKMTAADLWKDYQHSAVDANARYWGRAVEVSGPVTNASTGTTAQPFVFFKQEGGLGVQANLLDDQAAEILTSASAGRRLTLKCFAAGLVGNVILKSCVRPGPGR
jgi:hypothetical protein